MMFRWLAEAYSKHMLAEIEWLRGELRFERDRNARLQEHFISLSVRHPVYATAPPASRSEDDSAQKMAAAVKSVEEMQIGEIPG
jgi:hypothetical protein